MNTTRTLCTALALMLTALPAAADSVQQAAQRALQMDILHHHIIPEQQRAAEAAAAAAASRGLPPGHYYVENYLYHAPGYSAFAIGSEPPEEVRHKEGHLMVRTQLGSGGTDYYKGSERLAHARSEAIRICAGGRAALTERCKIIAEVGNSCMAVAEGEASSFGDNVKKFGIHGRLYRRFYVAMLQPSERGDPQSEPSEAQIKQWRSLLSNRALQMCQADTPHPLHKCIPDVWARCGIDGIITGTRPVN